MKVFWQYIDALKITINKLYQIAAFSPQKDAVLTQHFILRFNICRWFKANEL